MEFYPLYSALADLYDIHGISLNKDEFEKNYRENEAKRGLGLGLNMVKNICDKYKITYDV